MRGPIRISKVSGPIKISHCRANLCFDIAGIERQGAFEKVARLGKVFIGQPFV